MHKLIGKIWYVWGPFGKTALKTTPSCMRLRKKIDPPGTHYADSKNIVVRSTVGTDSYTSWRDNLQNLLRSAQNDSDDESHRFGYGVIYDAVNWTPGRYAPEMYSSLLECGALLAKKRFDERDLRKIQNLLRDAGFSLTPPRPARRDRKRANRSSSSTRLCPKK